MFFVNVRLKCIFLALEESTSQKTPPPFGFFIATPGWSPSAVGLVGRPCRAGRLMQNWHINLANFFTSTNGIRERDWWPYFRRTQVICSVTYTALAAAATQLLPPACPTAICWPVDSLDIEDSLSFFFGQSWYTSAKKCHYLALACSSLYENSAV